MPLGTSGLLIYSSYFLLRSSPPLNPMLFGIWGRLGGGQGSPKSHALWDLGEADRGSHPTYVRISSITISSSPHHR